MQGFENLPRSTQIRRLRRLAQCALTAYELESAHITPLHHFLNTTFRIDIPSHKQRYVLRISRAGYQDAATIRSELLWLQAIRRETDLVVSEPLANRDGLLLTTAEVPGVPQPRHCVLFRWVDGPYWRACLWRKGGDQSEAATRWVEKLAGPVRYPLLSIFASHERLFQ